MKINWRQKLTSRKFWAMVTTLVTTILIALNVNSLTIEQVTVILGGVGSVVAYILAEGYTDAHRIPYEED
jgi:hypothetical protein